MSREPMVWHQWYGHGPRVGLTQDEAIAGALSESQPGDLVIVHEKTCRIGKIEKPTDEDFDSCGCEVQSLVVGASA